MKRILLAAFFAALTIAPLQASPSPGNPANSVEMQASRRRLESELAMMRAKMLAHKQQAQASWYKQGPKALKKKPVKRPKIHR